MPLFMLIVVDDPAREWGSPEAQAAEMKRMGEFAAAQAREGRMRGGNPLTGMDQAARVQIRDRKPLVSDGPFAETKEMIAGFFMIEAEDRAQAIEIAKQCPHAEIGPVEVREVIPMGPPPR